VRNLRGRPDACVCVAGDGPALGFSQPRALPDDELVAHLQAGNGDGLAVLNDRYCLAGKFSLGGTTLRESSPQSYVRFTPSRFPNRATSA
jgi:hypothetical protein